jgi:hypothetical protein
VQSWFKSQIGDACATQSFPTAMLAITSCAERIRSVLDIFVHPMTLLKLQSMLNSELVLARGGFCVVSTDLILISGSGGNWMVPIRRALCSVELAQACVVTK